MPRTEKLAISVIGSRLMKAEEITLKPRPGAVRKGWKDRILK